MMRLSFAAALFFAACATAAAQEAPRAEDETVTAQESQVRRDGFVITNDECGASRYSHLLDENFAEMYQAALLPNDLNVRGYGQMTTLEFKPGQLNVVVNGEGRIIAIGCF
jgi:hypothetical protein